ncbi:MAG: hypothetical protein L3J53_05080 [Proteobacteria bacterium]|nr:hypothetical protein [Pseudomonadota bacterium]
MFQKMFQKIKQKIEEMQEKQKQLYQTLSDKFDDPVAKNTDWFPAKSGGIIFKTHNLHKISGSVYRFQLSTGGKLFIGIFAIIGLIVAIVGVSMIFSSNTGGFFPLVFGVIFSTAAYVMYKTIGQAVVFDRTMGLVWVGHKTPKLSGEQKSKQNLIYFNDIYAIQILFERVRANKSNYTSYEINLILKDATRFNVIDHGNYTQIILDAETLSEFLGKPIWDVS